MSTKGSKKRPREDDTRRTFTIYKLDNYRIHEAPFGYITVKKEDAADTVKQKIDDCSGNAYRYFAVKKEDLYDLIAEGHYTADELLVVPLPPYHPSRATSKQFNDLVDVMGFPIEPIDCIIPADVLDDISSSFETFRWYQQIDHLDEKVREVQGKEAGVEFGETFLKKLYRRQLEDIASGLQINTKLEWKICEVSEELVAAGLSRMDGKADVVFLDGKGTKMLNVLTVVEVKLQLPSLSPANSPLTQDERQLLSVLLLAQKRSANYVIGALTDLYSGWIFYWWQKAPGGGEIKFRRTDSLHPRFALPFLRCVLALNRPLKENIFRFKPDDTKNDEPDRSDDGHKNEFNYCLHRIEGGGNAESGANQAARTGDEGGSQQTQTRHQNPTSREFENHPAFIEEWEKYKTIDGLDMLSDEELQPHKKQFISKLEDRVIAHQIASLLRNDDDEQLSERSEMEDDSEPRMVPHSSNEISVRQWAENVPTLSVR